MASVGVLVATQEDGLVAWTRPVIEEGLMPEPVDADRWLERHPGPLNDRRQFWITWLSWAHRQVPAPGRPLYWCPYCARAKFEAGAPLGRSPPALLMSEDMLTTECNTCHATWDGIQWLMDWCDLCYTAAHDVCRLSNMLRQEPKPGDELAYALLRLLYGRTHIWLGSLNILDALGWKQTHGNRVKLGRAMRRHGFLTASKTSDQRQSKRKGFIPLRQTLYLIQREALTQSLYPSPSVGSLSPGESDA